MGNFVHGGLRYAKKGDFLVKFVSFFFSFTRAVTFFTDVVGGSNFDHICNLVAAPGKVGHGINFHENFFHRGRKTGKKMQVVVFFDFDREL